MSNYATLKAAISTAIKQNGNEEITGQVLQTTLLSMVDSLVSGYLFKGIATPSTVVGTPDENMFWIAPAGSYSNFGATPIDVPTGCIGIFQYNGSFTNTVVYVGGTVDISALSHTAYASLSQALGDLPAALQIGGIEMRYQDSTTSKFVKYRLMATSWSTAENDWQGVDDEPTAGSDNLVTSGGVANYVSAIPHPFFAKNYPFITEIYINSKGVTADVYNIHSIGYLQKIVRFSTSLGTWAGETKQIPYVDNILAITPRGASDLSVIYGYVVVDWAQISADVDIVEKINDTAQSIAFSPTIKDYLKNGISVSKMSLSDIPDNVIIKVLDINGSGNYTDFSTAMDDLIANERTQPLSQVLLYIKKGTYIVTPNTSPRSSGPIVGCSIVAEEGATIVCNYDGADPSKVQSFSPINLYAEVSHPIVINGLRVIVKNCRYCIHDEMGSLLVDNYTHIFKNCSFTHQTAPNSNWASPRCIGGGLGNGGNIVIEDCEFESQIATSVDYHSGRDGGATGSKIIVQNCIAPKNTISGTTTQQANANSSSILIVTNCILDQSPIQNNYQGRAEVKVLSVGNNVR